MTDRRPPLLPALLLGIGLGGFVDGILLHQVLQWHHMLTDEGCCPPGTVAGLEDNTLADGFFHIATWLAVLAGTVTATRAWQRGELAPPWRSHIGGLLLGWGLFNLLEGLIDHQILGIHHVRDDLGGPIGWDLGFLALGAVQVTLGWILIKRPHRKRLF
jgi:uncharacterized membrane protein